MADVVVRELASYQRGPGSIPRLGVICGLSLLVLYSAQKGSSPMLRFSPFSLQCPQLVLQRWNY